MRWKYTLILMMISFAQLPNVAFCQTKIMVSGTVYDSSKIYVIPSVQVFTTSGVHAETDSLGIYHILATMQDSIYFFFQGKNSIKYPVSKVYDYAAFDISMHVRAATKYKILQPVTVFSNSYKMDSLENRERYEKIFGSSKPTLETSTGPNGAGLDIGSLVEIFQFKKNKQRQAFQQRLIDQERDGYVDYRFNSKLITRITGLTGKDLEDYKKMYQPSYDFVAYSTQVQFYQYILNTSYVFKRQRGID